jgi:hypothetical protein
MSFYERLIEQGYVRRFPVTAFNAGDGIGTFVDPDTGVPRPRGTVVVSEPNPGGRWHLAWTQPDTPGQLFHWRGDLQVRDVRWVVPLEFLIDEMP